MTLRRRDFLRGMTTASAAVLFRHGVKSIAQAAPGEDALILDARGHVHPVVPSPLHLGGTRVTARGEESLRLTNLYWEQRLRDKVTGKESVRPTLPVCGEFHFARCNPEFWEDGLRKMKACGVTAVSTYVFWILHEPEEGRFDWRDRRDLRRFVDLCARQGLDVYLRTGPFAHGEMRNGGLPDWLYGKPFEVRSNDPAYLACVQRFYAEIGRQIQDYLWQSGGPIAGIQLENEFMAASAPWEVAQLRDQPIEWITRGSGGAEHMTALKKIAIESGLRAPVYTATAWGSPIPPLEFLPTHGGYGFEPWSVDPQTHKQKPSWTFLFSAAQAKSRVDGDRGGTGAGQFPYACCELGGGMECFYLDRFVVPPESIQATAITALGSGCAFLGYYVFHGGSNPAGEHVFYGEYDVPRISYGFQAPIREYGQLADSYRAVRLVHLFLGSWGERLATMQTALPADAGSLTPENSTAVRSALRTDGEENFLFVNNYQDHVQLPERRNLRFRIQLDGGEQMLPSANGLSLASGESAILPAGVRLGKLRLAWSTAQLLTQIDHAGARHVFLFTPRGAQPELALAAEGITQCTAEGAELLRDRQHWIVRGSAERPVHVRSVAGGEIVWLHVLPREQALHISRHWLWGMHRLVFSHADAAEQDGQLVLWSAAAEAEALLFPPLPAAASLDSTVFPGASRLRGTRQEWQGGVRFERLTDSTLRIRVAARALAGVDNVLLRICYAGDMGQLFLRNVLVADNFANGASWEIGLRQLRLGDEDSELILKIVPRDQDNPVQLDETVPHPERFAGKHVAVIESAEAVPIYRFHFATPEAL